MKEQQIGEVQQHFLQPNLGCLYVYFVKIKSCLELTLGMLSKMTIFQNGRHGRAEKLISVIYHLIYVIEL